jgi:hypothetical protein
VALPTISGTVTNLTGQPVADVVLQPAGGWLPATTDTNGVYSLPVPPGWNGTVTPALGSFVFVPSARSYTNVLESVAAQDFLMAESVAPPLGSGLSGTNLWLNWTGIQGVSYQAWWSTNLTEWFPLGDALAGTNGLMELLLPLDEQPMHFFRLRASH